MPLVFIKLLITNARRTTFVDKSIWDVESVPGKNLYVVQVIRMSLAELNRVINNQNDSLDIKTIRLQWSYRESPEWIASTLKALHYWFLSQRPDFIAAETLIDFRFLRDLFPTLLYRENNGILSNRCVKHSADGNLCLGDYSTEAYRYRKLRWHTSSS